MDKTVERTTPYNVGWKDYCEGREDCPFRFGSRAAREWADGWYDAQDSDQDRDMYPGDWYDYV